MDDRALAVIIPAWNCESTIARSLNSLKAQKASGFGEVHVVIAVNDGNQRSIRAVEDHKEDLVNKGYKISILKTPTGRKSAFEAARNIILENHDILYLDQDAALSSNALSSLYGVLLERHDAAFVTFSLKFTESPSWIVRRFIKSWFRFNYIKASPVVAGAYCITALNHVGFEQIPDQLPDDKFMRLQFDPDQRVLIESAEYEVLSANSYQELIRERARYMRSNREISLHFKGRPVRDTPRYEGWMRQFVDPLSFLILGATMALSWVVSKRE